MHGSGRRVRRVWRARRPGSDPMAVSAMCVTERPGSDPRRDVCNPTTGLTPGACATLAARDKIRGVTSSRTWPVWACTLVLALGLTAILAAHPAPFSYLDVHIAPDGLSGRLVVHDLDVAHELKLEDPTRLADRTYVDSHAAALGTVLADRLSFLADGRAIPWTLQAARPVPGQDAVEMTWRAPAAGAPGKLTIAAHLFPYDVNHQTFINVYEAGTLMRQEVLGRERTSVDFFTGTRQGLLAVFTTFTASGIHHIAIGPDHILFIIGLLLLGGTLPRLLLIVTAFTLGHSVTLALATLQILDPPARIIEPAIALSIVYVGADNLLTGTRGRDVRAWVALLFGLVHGFGFASVLRDAGLPNRALGMSLFSFNLGVEIGQAIIVAVVATALSLLRHWSATVARHIVTVGSVVVMLAGAFWFIERVF
jgi:hydrogenase/urease accessory protein HupE